MHLDFASLGLVKKNGIWYADNKAFVSYPDDGNNSCFQIEDKSFWFRHRNNCISELVKQFHKSGTFFDIGGGNGFVAKAIQDLEIDTVLVEPGDKGCINAINRKIKNVVCSTVEDAGFPENSMQSIGVFDVVEHFDDDMGLLKTLNKFLEKDGLLFISVPAYNFLWSVDDDYAGHFHRYTLGSLNEKLRKAGFKTEYSTYIFSILPLPVFLFRSLPSKIGIRKKPNYETNKPSEHTKDSSLLPKVWQWEIDQIKQQKKIPVGGSCLVVAKKI